MSSHQLAIEPPKGPWSVAAYTCAEVARLVHLDAQRVRRWLRGYEYRPVSKGGEEQLRRQEPIVRGGTILEADYASFLELIDLLLVKAFREHGVSLQRIRRALHEARDLLGSEHFARRVFFTNGKAIFLKLKENNIVELLAGGQKTFAKIIEEIYPQIEFDEPSGFARRWYPVKGSRIIALDPAVAFGRPMIVEKAIRTESIYDFYLAENSSIPRSCEWFGLTREQVEAAVRFQESIAA